MRLILTMIALFIVAQLLGIFTGVTILLDMDHNPYVQELIVTTDANEPANALFFIVYILMGAAAMILMIRLLRHYELVFVLMEFALVATAGSIVFYAFIRLFLGMELSTLGAIIMGLALSSLKLIKPGFKNAAAIFATAGAGVIFGISLGLVPLIIFLVFLSIYDYLAVFKTKHMVEMANFVVRKNLAFTVTAKVPTAKPGEKKRIDLGTGDMIAPVMLEVSAMTFSPVATVFVFIGAVVSFSIFLHFVWNKKMVLPALPPIVFGMVVFLLAGFLLGFYHI
ncbi:hypothetical protein JXA56_02320 [Candidatus Micrarchaeota archaeon]|nr:hypothetical protein [Candidatus Micrarchaeota archaeon]